MGPTVGAVYDRAQSFRLGFLGWVAINERVRAVTDRAYSGRPLFRWVSGSAFSCCGPTHTGCDSARGPARRNVRGSSTCCRRMLRFP